VSLLHRTIAPLAFAVALAGLSTAPTFATTITASQIPDGTYTVKVEKIVDSKHILVALDNGNETTLGAGRDTVDFSKVQINDQLKLSLIQGAVVVFADLTTH
jgi:hypothetical protein